MANSKADQLKARTKRFALDVLSFRRTLPAGDEAADIGRQLSRSATAVAANYRSACRSRSDAEFAARIGAVLEEAKRKNSRRYSPRRPSPPGDG
jgi:four helix bundle protein